jgi:photosystem II stability/assembly factor-like uncharacterized protein
MKRTYIIGMLQLLLTGAFLLISTSSFAQPAWYKVNSGVTNKLLTVDFPSNSIGYIGGEDSLLLKTTDGGVTWNPIAYSGINTGFESDFNNIQFVDENIGYLSVGDFGGIYKTVDGGLTWNQLGLSGSLCYTRGMFWRAEDIGVVGGSGCFQGEQFDVFTPFGSSPAAVNSPGWGAQENMIDDIDFSPGGAFGMAASRGGRICRTFDGGNNWDTIPTGWGSGYSIKAISVINDSTAYFTFEGPMSGRTAIKTTDMGNTWFSDGLTFGSPVINDLHVSGDSTIWGAGSGGFGPNGGMHERIDDSWWMVYNLDQMLNSVSSYNDSIIWAVGDSGYIVVNDNLGVLGIIQPEREKLAFYPNPVNDMIQLDLPYEIRESAFEISIYNTTGQLVESIKNNAIQVDLTQLKSGLYIIELKSANTIFSSRLIKQ